MTKWQTLTADEKAAIYARQREIRKRKPRTAAQKLADKVRRRAWYETNKEAVLKKTAAYHAAHPEIGRASVRKYTAKNKDRYRAWNRRQKLYTKYGITLQQYEFMLQRQNGACAVCLRQPRNDSRRLAVDHDHDTGRVRGLVCWWCNHKLLAKRVTAYDLRRAADMLESKFDGRNL